jgi:uncharacterized protein (DUF1810 family)
MDPLQHFLDAQALTYDTALAELRAGRKRTHWMWFIFPQLAGLGTSPRAQRFAIPSLQEAERYLAHPVLGGRLIACSEALLTHEGTTAEAVMGTVNAMKLRSSMTLFAQAANAPSVFDAVMARYFDGMPDERTIALLHATP